MINCFKDWSQSSIYTFFTFFVLKQSVGYQGWNSQNTCQNSKKEYPAQTASLEAIWSGSALFV